MKADDREDALSRPANPEQIKYFTDPEELPLIHNTELDGGSDRDEGVFKWLISPESGSQNLHVGVGWLKPGEVHLLHHHLTESEFYYVLEGSVLVSVNDQVQHVFPGGAVYIPAGATHKIVNDSDAVCGMLFGYNTPCCSNIFDE
jgi:mannose-6-phosphate isomerase-like protein (cupin superfamily)